MSVRERRSEDPRKKMENGPAAFQSAGLFQRWWVRTAVPFFLLFSLFPAVAWSQMMGAAGGAKKDPVGGSETSARAVPVREKIPVTGPIHLFFLPVPLWIPAGDAKHPPGLPLAPSSRPVTGGDFFPVELTDRDQGAPGLTLEPYSITEGLITLGHYRLFLLYIEQTGDHCCCHPYEPYEKNHRPEGWDEALARSSPLLPMTDLDWFDAFAFCSWSGGRLPTEWQWEWAGEGGVLWEWCGSWYRDEYYLDPEAIRADPRGPADGTVELDRWTLFQNMVIRRGEDTPGHSPGGGASTGDPAANDADSRGRSYLNIYVRDSRLGFRCIWPSPAESSVPDVPVSDPDLMESGPTASSSEAADSGK